MISNSFFSRFLLTSSLLLTLLHPISASAAIKFRRPLDTVLSPVFSAHYDNDSTVGKMRNYYCGTDTTYDNHRGTDFRASVGTPIYAAKTGGLYYRYDGCSTYGYSGSTCGGGYGNHVRIDHEGSFTDGAGVLTIYGHMKQGTAAYYQTAGCGKKIGETGSSGNATGPHLHFEVRKLGYPLDDAFAGMCSRSGGFWTNQNGGVPTTQCTW